MASVPPTVQVGDRLSYDGAACTVRFVGTVKGTSGSWLGVEWDDPARGKHDGSHKGERYFTCTSQSPTAASFVRPTRPAEPARGFLEALVEKYTAELADTAVIKFSGKVAEEVGFDKTRRQQANLGELRVAILDGERIVSAYGPQKLDGEKTADQGGDTGSVPSPSSIAHTCPKVRDVDLSRNLFRQVGSVVEICAELPALRTLRLNGNRFEAVLDDEKFQQDSSRDALRGLEELALEETMLSWDEICHICSRCERLASLSASTNQLARLNATSSLLSSSLTSNLVALTLEFNDFTSLADIASLGCLQALRNLHLKGNNIETLLPKTQPGSTSTDTELEDEALALAKLNPTQYPPSSPLPVFSSSVQYLDISYNKVDSWDFIDGLHICFPGLTALRFAHNPIYDNPDPDNLATSSSMPSSSTTATTKNLTEEAYMFTVARLANLKALNFGTISPNDRQDAEMFYLSRIGKQLAASVSVPVPPTPAVAASSSSSSSPSTPGPGAAEKKQREQAQAQTHETQADARVKEQEEAFVRRHHPRFAALCELYGAPAVVRRHEVNPAFIEARLITVHLTLCHPTSSSPPSSSPGQAPDEEEIYNKTVQLPKGMDMYAVKGIVAKLFASATTPRVLLPEDSTETTTTRRRPLPPVRPLDLRLVWETGEWDPVADFDQEVDDSSDDEEGAAAADADDGNGSRPAATATATAAPTGLVEGREGGQGGAAVEESTRAGGKWIKREVELPDGPRQLGFCVDGPEVRIRVELRNTSQL